MTLIRDLIDVPEDTKKNLNFIFAKNVNDVLTTALDGEGKGTRTYKTAGTRKKANNTRKAEK